MLVFITLGIITVMNIIASVMCSKSVRYMTTLHTQMILLNNDIKTNLEAAQKHDDALLKEWRKIYGER